VYYCVVQDDYAQRDLRKLRRVTRAIHPSTQKILSERKVRQLIQQNTHSMPFERIQ
jgi:hypothetical protein